VNWGERLPSIPVDVPAFLAQPGVRWSFAAGSRRWSKDDGDVFFEAMGMGAVLPVESEARDSVVCPMFVVDQNGKKRLIFDLRPLNEQCLPPPHFDLDTILDVPTYLAAHRDVRLASKIDLTKAYWNVPVTAGSRCYLRCRGPDDKIYEWTCLPFGWAHAPALFQQISSCFRDAWRAAGVRTMVYLDDFVFFTRDDDEHARTMAMVVGDLLEAGWPLSVEKCAVNPASAITYLGVEVDVQARTLKMPSSKVERLAREAGGLLERAEAGRVPLHDLEAFAGRANFTRLVLPRAGVFLVHLYDLVARHRGLLPSLRADPVASPELLPCPTFRRCPHVSGITCTIESGAREELLWWRDVAPVRLARRTPWNRLAVARVWFTHGARLDCEPRIAARSDASDNGIGGSWCWTGDPSAPTFVHDLIPEDLRASSSTARELYGAVRLLEALPSLPVGAVVRFTLDSQAAVGTVAGGGACLGTVQAARRLDAELERRGVEAVFEWARRAELAAEDAASRRAFEDPANSTVTPASLTFLIGWAFGGQMPEVDAFASEAVHFAPIFGSRWPGGGSSGDGVSLIRSLDACGDSGPRRIWVFPPFRLARAAIIAAIEVSTVAPSLQVLLLVPFSLHEHHCLTSSGWRHVSGPRTLKLPCGAIRAPSRSLVAYASPACVPCDS
jgi:hypothetical protein